MLTEGLLVSSQKDRNCVDPPTPPHCFGSLDLYGALQSYILIRGSTDHMPPQDLTIWFQRTISGGIPEILLGRILTFM